MLSRLIADERTESRQSVRETRKWAKIHAFPERMSVFFWWPLPKGVNWENSFYYWPFNSKLDYQRWLRSSTDRLQQFLRSQDISSRGSTPIINKVHLERQLSDREKDKFFLPVHEWVWSEPDHRTSNLLRTLSYIMWQKSVTAVILVILVHCAISLMPWSQVLATYFRQLWARQ